MPWVRRACGLLAILALAHLTYELSFSFQKRAPATAAPEITSEATSQAARPDQSAEGKYFFPRLPGRWEMAAGNSSSESHPEHSKPSSAASQKVAQEAGSNTSKQPQTGSISDTAESAGSLDIDKIMKDPRAAGSVLPAKGAAKQGLLKQATQTSLTQLGGLKDVSADGLRAQLREAARPILSERVRSALHAEIASIASHVAMLRMRPALLARKAAFITQKAISGIQQMWSWPS